MKKRIALILLLSVCLVMERALSGDICVGLNEEESGTVLDILYEADTGKFEDTESSNTGGNSVYFRLMTDSGQQYVQILNNENAQYLVLQNEDENLFLTGPASAFDFSTLSELAENALQDDEEPDYAGTVEFISSGEIRSVNRANSAYAKSWLESAASENGTNKSDAADSYNLKF